ncbi:phospholipid carrier-dependent glycosyltransferase [Heliobacterium undosum]|uniref:Phospholipid carrier-dependent glycosyltransferase n=1 Tax=Heliomicrobium undosum TaxID=121734 RepID=A0A845L367_9FIRM|nr:glycosyltransferase family 39 protein [Heliomicrobium undosum]MZP29559.1 phospholipid carrier-dependent glycosyltransferase [Heliomicrobium undosum]
MIRSFGKTLENLVGNLLNHAADRRADLAERHYWFSWVLLLLVALINLFYHLGSFSICDWDEARHGVSAYEMIRSGNYIVNTYNFEQDYWNLKPPISFWAIAAGYAVAGFNPWGMRLGSAVAALLTILAVGWFVRRQYGNLASLLSMTALVTTPQYILWHSARRADADSLFVFFFTLSILALLLSNKHRRWLYLSGFAFSLAFLTKSWHAISIAVISGMYLLLTGMLFRLRYKEAGGYLFCAAGSILLWASARLAVDGPTFFTEMVSFDLLARTSTPLEGHVGDGWFYFHILQMWYYRWLLLLAAGGVVFLVLRKKRPVLIEQRDTALGLFLWLVVPFFLFSLAKTKIEWYILPIYPAFAVIIGAITASVLREYSDVKTPFLHGHGESAAVVWRVVLSSVIVALFLFSAIPYEQAILRHIQHPEAEADHFQALLKDLGSRTEYRGGPMTQLGPWRQSHLLAAELYGDWRARTITVEEYLRERRGLLVLGNNEDNRRLVFKERLHVVAENSDYLIAAPDGER